MLNLPEEQKNYVDNIKDENEQKNYLESSSDTSLYVQHFDEQQAVSSLEQNAPILNNPIERSINKKALVFMGLMGLVVFGFIVYTVQLFSTSEESATPVEQTVSIPEPDLPPPPPLAQTQPVVVQQASPAEVPPIEITQHDELEQQFRQPEISTSIPAEIDPIESMRKSQDALLVEDAQVTGNEAQNSVAQISAKYLPNRDKLLIQGTYLRCILETKIVSDIPGFTSCVITEPVYSASGMYELIPKGSKVLGQYGSTNPTSGRLGVIWDRVITPSGVDVSLKSPGVDNLGASGHVGKFQSHWGSRLASALLISMISDGFKYAGAEYGPQGTTETTNSSTITNPYESETANTLKQQAINQLERNNMRPNTVTINQGSLINIYTAQDIDFSGVVY